MANTNTSTPTPPAEAEEKKKVEYDPAISLKVFLADNPGAPKYLGNYLIHRLGDQIGWYDKKSSIFKVQWERNRKRVIILSASIPFMVGLIGLGLGGDVFNKYFDFFIKIIVGMAGVTIAVLEGFNSLFKSQDLYVDYRATAEHLKQEFGYFLGSSGDYTGLSGDASYAKLIANAEAIMANQNNKWAELTRKKEKSEMADEIQKVMLDFMKQYGITSMAPPKPVKPDAPPPPPNDEGQPTPPQPDPAIEPAEEDPEI